MALTIKQNDTFPPLEVVLSDLDGTVDLSTADEVRMLMKLANTLVEGVMTIDPDQVTNKGKATYTWVAGDTATVGEYQVEFQVTWSTGVLQTFPNDGYEAIIIEADLGP